MTSYHLGYPQIRRYWMFVDVVLLLSIFILPWKHSIHMLYLRIYVFCILRSCEMMYCIDLLIFIITYLTTCAVYVVIWMCYIISFVLMYLLMRLYMYYSFMIMSIVLKTNLINKTFLNVTQHEGTLEELKLYF